MLRPHRRRTPDGREIRTVNNITYEGQYEFRKNHFTFMEVMEMYDKISEAIEINNLHDYFSIGVFLDLSKAFILTS